MEYNLDEIEKLIIECNQLENKIKEEDFEEFLKMMISKILVIIFIYQVYVNIIDPTLEILDHLCV